MRWSLLTILLIALRPPSLSAQVTAPYKFAKITPAALANRTYPVDTAASAVVIADVGRIVLEGNTRNSFRYVMNRRQRAHILKQGGYPLATVEIPLFINGASGIDRVSEIRAVTYNLENGAVTETKLGKEAIFRERRMKNIEIVRFTLPALREGSIIDFEYKLESDYIYNLPNWYFQGEYPCAWSEVTLTVPYFLYYAQMEKGIKKFALQESDRSQDVFTMSDNEAARGGSSLVRATTIIKHWAMKDVPAFLPPSFVYYRPDHQSHLEFQLLGIKTADNQQQVVPSWVDHTDALVRDLNFGVPLDRNNFYFDNIIPGLRSDDKLQEVRNAYNYIRDHIKCNGQRGIYLDNGLREVFSSGTGSVAEVNLLLTALLHKLGHNAAPVILTTRDNGAVYGAVPMLRKMNYVIVELLLNGNAYTLDASVPHLPFGELRPYCYNGIGHRIDKSAAGVNLGGNRHTERKITSVMLNDGSGTQVKGVFQQLAGMQHSFDIRSAVSESDVATYQKKWLRERGDAVRFYGLRFDSLQREEQPVNIHSEVSIDLGTDSVVYIDPLFGEGLGENPFKSPTREFPVELNSAIDESYMLTFFVPEGYVVEQLPRSQRFSLNEYKEGSFEYEASESDGIIRVQMGIKLKRTMFRPDDYEMLRSFYELIAEKQKDRIVLKKKK